MPPDERTNEIRRTIEGLTGVPSSEGNQVDVLKNGDQIFPAMLDAIGEAERFIDLLTFIYWTGDIARDVAEALGKRASEGVEVRVLLDAVGARLMPKDVCSSMVDAGCDVRWFRPPTWRPWVMEHRTHRKVLLTDQNTGFTGGVGIAEEWCGDARDETEWRDTHFRVRGPAVGGLRGAFVTNWIEATEGFEPGHGAIEHDEVGDHVVQVVRSSASIGWSTMALVIRSLIHCAEERLRIGTAYFTPDDVTLDLMCDKAEEGVEVELLVPGPHADKRIIQLAGERSYERLLDAGVTVWSFQPTMFHTKVLTVDHRVALVGSANINGRSMARDDEVAMVLYDDGLVATLDEHYDDDVQRSERIEDPRWQGRPIQQQLLEKMTRLINSRI